jgi:hypothetical protein
MIFDRVIDAVPELLETAKIIQNMRLALCCGWIKVENGGINSFKVNGQTHISLISFSFSFLSVQTAAQINKQTNRQNLKGMPNGEYGENGALVSGKEWRIFSPLLKINNHRRN